MAEAHKWILLDKREPDSEGSVEAPFDGKVYLFGTQELIFSGRWTVESSNPHWDFLDIYKKLPEGKVFWRETPTGGKYEDWLAPMDATAISIIGAPSHKKLIVRVDCTKMYEQWLEAVYVPEQCFWSWPGRRKTKRRQRPFGQGQIKGGYLIDIVPEHQVQAELRSQGVQLWG